MQDRSNFWTRNWKRRRFLSGSALAAGGAASIALVGCGDDDDDDDDGDGGNGGDGPTNTPVSTPTATPAAAEAVLGGTLTLSSGTVRSLDPHFDTFPSTSNVANNIYSSLIKFTPDLSEITTDMAESLPENPDETTFVVTLQDGITWQDVAPLNGRALTAEDVKASIERQMTDEPGKFQHAYFFLGAVDSIDAPDEKTVRFNMSKPYAPMVSYLASPWTVIVSVEDVEARGDLTKGGVGAGPFLFDSWQQDVAVKVRKNPNYWKQDQFGTQLPYLDEIVWQTIIDPEVGATLFIDGELDGRTVGINQLQRVQDARSEATYKPQPSQFWRQIRMSPTTGPGTEPGPYQAPFDDIQVRQAIVQALNAQEMLDLVYSGDGILTHGPILPIYPPWALTETPAGAEFDLAAATALMSAAGNPTVEGNFIWATGSTEADQVAEITQQQLAQIGVNLTLEPKETASYYDQTYAYDYFMSSHVPLNNPDPDENLSSYFGRNSTFFKHYDEEIFDMIDQQAAALDPEERLQIVHDVSEKIVLKFPLKFAYTTNLHHFVRPELKGWFYEGDLYSQRLEGAWLDV